MKKVVKNKRLRLDRSEPSDRSEGSDLITTLFIIAADQNQRAGICGNMVRQQTKNALKQKEKKRGGKQTRLLDLRSNGL